MKYLVAPTGSKTILRSAFERLNALDKSNFFKNAGNVVDDGDENLATIPAIIEVYSDRDAAKKRAEELATLLNCEVAVAVILGTYRRQTSQYIPAHDKVQDKAVSRAIDESVRHEPDAQENSGDGVSQPAVEL